MLKLKNIIHFAYLFSTICLGQNILSIKKYDSVYFNSVDFFNGKTYALGYNIKGGPYFLLCDSQSNPKFVNNIYYDKTGPYSGGFDPSTLKVDSEGNSYIGGHLPGYTTENGVRIENNTSNLPTGVGFNGDTSFDYIPVIKYNAMGKRSWHKIFKGYQIKTTTIDVDNLGNVYLGGTFMIRPIEVDGFKTPIPAPGVHDVIAFMAKLDSNGKVKYLKSFGGRNFQNAISIKFNPRDLNVYLTGTYSRDIIFDNVKIDSKGAPNHNFF